jgi:hypothetical protein
MFHAHPRPRWTKTRHKTSCRDPSISIMNFKWMCISRFLLYNLYFSRRSWICFHFCCQSIVFTFYSTGNCNCPSSIGNFLQDIESYILYTYYDSCIGLYVTQKPTFHVMTHVLTGTDTALGFCWRSFDDVPQSLGPFPNLFPFTVMVGLHFHLDFHLRTVYTRFSFYFLFPWMCYNATRWLDKYHFCVEYSSAQVKWSVPNDLHVDISIV